MKEKSKKKKKKGGGGQRKEENIAIVIECAEIHTPKSRWLTKRSVNISAAAAIAAMPLFQERC